MTCSGIFAITAAVTLGVLTALGTFLVIALIGVGIALATGYIAEPWE